MRFRDSVKALLWRQMCKRSQPYPQADLAKSAMFFSPHFDDETLGCGGVIAKKKIAGAQVKVVFMTDGSQSHRKYMSGEELSKLRQNEGVAACAALGLESENAHLLNLPETELEKHKQAAKDSVKQLLVSFAPEEVFLPARKEPLLWSGDHLATTDIVCSGLRESGLEVTIYEYPIWLWYAWPWSKVPRNKVWQDAGKWRSTLSANRALLQEFRCACFIGDQLEIKKAALGQHASQMTRLNNNEKWRILPDVANGEFLACFFRDYEFFHKATI